MPAGNSATKKELCHKNQTSCGRRTQQARGKMGKAERTVKPTQRGLISRFASAPLTPTPPRETPESSVAPGQFEQRNAMFQRNGHYEKKASTCNGKTTNKQVHSPQTNPRRTASGEKRDCLNSPNQIPTRADSQLSTQPLLCPWRSPSFR
jgi:hypothetical protein